MINRSILFALIVLFIVPACTIQKRRHLKGYHVVRHTSFHKKESADAERTKEEKAENQALQEVLTPPENKEHSLTTGVHSVHQQYESGDFKPAEEDQQLQTPNPLLRHISESKPRVTKPAEISSSTNSHKSTAEVSRLQKPSDAGSLSLGILFLFLAIFIVVAFVSLLLGAGSQLIIAVILILLFLPAVVLFILFLFLAIYFFTRKPQKTVIVEEPEVVEEPEEPKPRMSKKKRIATIITFTVFALLVLAVFLV